MKKFIALLAAAACVPTRCLAVEAAERVPVISLNAGYGSESDETKVKVNISGGGICAYSIEVGYDPDALYFLGAESGDGLSGGTFYCNDTASDTVKLVWSNSRNQECDGAAAVLRFRAAYGTAESDTRLTLGHAQLADDLSEAKFISQDCVMKIASEINKGDVNRDGVVNISDIVGLNKYLLDEDAYPLDYGGQANADVTENGNVTSTDSTLLMNYVCMIIKEL